MRMGSFTERPVDKLGCVLALAAVTSLTAIARGQQCIETGYAEPALDRWMYPFNATPGFRFASSLFGNVGAEADPDFDNRDGQMIVGYDTSGDVPTGLDPETYQVRWLRIFLQSDGTHQIEYDPTQDPWQSYLDPEDPRFVPDPDPGRPIELFGAGYRNGWTAETFLENSPYGDQQFGQGQRNVFAIAFDEFAEPFDVSNSVRDEIDPLPWAVGQIDGLQPGDFIPLLTDIEFAIDVSDPHVQQHLAEGLHDGRLRLVVTSMHGAGVQSGLFPTIVNKESPLPGAARVELGVRLGSAADVNCDGDVDVIDLVDVILGWGSCEGGTCNPDVNLDGDVTVQDLIAVILGWNPG